VRHPASRQFDEAEVVALPDTRASSPHSRMERLRPRIQEALSPVATVPQPSGVGTAAHFISSYIPGRRSFGAHQIQIAILAA
jgi:hypothetical protein